MVNVINKVNNGSKATSISCFDFLTNFTTIPHDKLMKVLWDIIDFALKEVIIYSSQKIWYKMDRQGSLNFNQHLKCNTCNRTAFFIILTKYLHKLLGFLWETSKHHFWQIFFLIIMRANG